MKLHLVTHNYLVYYVFGITWSYWKVLEKIVCYAWSVGRFGGGKKL